MNLTFKYIVLTLITSLFMCCGTNKTIKEARVNTTPNAEYRESRKAFADQLSTSEYNNIKAILEKELHTTIPNGKSILINFNQKASNCLEIRFNNIKGFVKRGMEISSKMSTKYNAIDFFVYTNDAYYKDIYEENPNFVLDSGFFRDNIFTLHENCKAFIIIKPNGAFYKFYGEDYYSEVKKFFEQD